MFRMKGLKLEKVVSNADKIVSETANSHPYACWDVFSSIFIVNRPVKNRIASFLASSWSLCYST